MVSAGKRMVMRRKSIQNNVMSLQRITSRPRDVKHHGYYAPKQSIILFKTFIFIKTK